MTILHGDDRFYNNIFVQKYPVDDTSKTPQDPDYPVVGTSPMDIFPTNEEWLARFDFTKEPDMGALAAVHFDHLPVWVEGNAYLAGAEAWKHEKINFIDKDAKVTVELTSDKDGCCKLKTNLYDYIKDFSIGVINSDTLGKAFEPEERYENPDGTDIIFDSDYFGNHRGISTIPGPFSTPEDIEKILW